MAQFRVYFSARFSSRLCGYEKDFREWAEKIAGQVAQNPIAGKPLGTKWLREKKFGKKRVYYLVYEEFAAVYFVAISEKKDQANAIAFIKMNIDVFRQELEETLKKT